MTCRFLVLCDALVVFDLLRLGFYLVCLFDGLCLLLLFGFLGIVVLVVCCWV